jgi:hypothetical protein
MYRPYYVPSSGPNLNLPYEYGIPYQQYQTSPWYTAPTYDINRVPAGSVPSGYTFDESRDKGTPRSHLGLNDVYSPVPDYLTDSPVPDYLTHHQGETGRE